MAESIIKDKGYSFALAVVAFCGQLSREREYVLSKQLLKSGTSIGANVEEALAGQSRKDFLSKMAIASKEARETIYWLRLLRDSGLVKGEKVHELLQQAQSLSRMLTAIVKTTQERPRSTAAPRQPGRTSDPPGVYSSSITKSSSSNSKPKTHNSKPSSSSSNSSNSKPKTHHS